MNKQDNNIAVFQDSWGTGVDKIDVSVSRCGSDVVVVMAGGTLYHTGAVALAIPRPSLSDPAQLSASASVLCVTGHKEDELARNAALRLAAAINCTVTVVAGVHIDGITPASLSQVLTNCNCLIERIILRCKETPAS